MFKNYLLVAARNLKRSPGYSLINLIGFGFAIGICLLIYIFISFETSYDKFNPKSYNSYRITMSYTARGEDVSSAISMLEPDFKNYFPEIKAAGRLFTYSWNENALVAAGSKSFFEEGFFLADAELPEIFSFKMLHGDLSNTLASPEQLAVSQDIAVKYFGTTDVIGKTLSIKNMQKADFIISSVFKNFPPNSHFYPEIIASVLSGDKLFWEGFARSNSFYNYINVADDTDIPLLEKKITSFMSEKMPRPIDNLKYSLQPLGSIHLHSDLSNEISANSDVSYIYLLSLAGFIILLSSCINFVNLSIARYERRIKEVGLRKAVGAGKTQLILQFLSESLFLSYLSVPMAIAVIYLFKPFFEKTLNTNFTFEFIPVYLILSGIFIIPFVTGMLAGIYPAYLISAYNPDQALKQKINKQFGRAKLRNFLIAVQYTASIMLIIGAAVVYLQLNYIKSKKLGFERDNIIILRMPDRETQMNYSYFKNVLINKSGIEFVTAGPQPSSITVEHNLWREGLTKDQEEKIIWADVDADYFNCYGMEVIRGRAFSDKITADAVNGYMINEAAEKYFGWEDGVGRQISLSNKDLMRPSYKEGKVIGIVKNFHSQSLHSKITPVVFTFKKFPFRYIAIKISGDNIPATLQTIKDEWGKAFPGRTMEYNYFSDNVMKLYEKEQRTENIIIMSAVVSIIITCLGLFGLISFSMANRSKEIGIRKVLGASVSDIINMTIKGFIIIFIVSNITAWAAGYYFMNGWLEKFAYRIEINLILVAAVTLITFTIFGLSTISQILKAALANPADSIKYE